MLLVDVIGECCWGYCVKSYWGRQVCSELWHFHVFFWVPKDFREFPVRFALAFAVSFVKWWRGGLASPSPHHVNFLASVTNS